MTSIFFLFLIRLSLNILSPFLYDTQKILFRDLFCGKLSQQVKSLECPHISEREEGFFALQCEIKGKKNVHESLKTYVQGEVLDGDNKYFCAQCAKHVGAVKRCLSLFLLFLLPLKSWFFSYLFFFC